MKRNTKWYQLGLTSLEVVIVLGVYAMLTTALTTTQKLSNEEALVAYSNFAADPMSALNQFALDSAKYRDASCDADLTRDQKALCRTTRQLDEALASLGLNFGDVGTYVANNPEVVAELWEIAFLFDEDEDGLVEFDELPNPALLVEDLEFEAEDLAIDFNVGTFPDGTYSNGDVVSTWNKFLLFSKGVVQEATGEKVKGKKGKKGEKGKKKDDDSDDSSNSDDSDNDDKSDKKDKKDKKGKKGKKGKNGKGGKKGNNGKGGKKGGKKKN